jgi:hypothetical protein
MMSESIEIKEEGTGSDEPVPQGEWKVEERDSQKSGIYSEMEKREIPIGDATGLGEHVLYEWNASTAALEGWREEKEEEQKKKRNVFFLYEKENPPIGRVFYRGKRFFIERSWDGHIVIRPSFVRIFLRKIRGDMRTIVIEKKAVDIHVPLLYSGNIISWIEQQFFPLKRGSQSPIIRELLKERQRVLVSLLMG